MSHPDWNDPDRPVFLEFDEGAHADRLHEAQVDREMGVDL